MASPAVVRATRLAAFLLFLFCTLFLLQSQQDHSSSTVDDYQYQESYEHDLDAAPRAAVQALPRQASFPNITDVPTSTTTSSPTTVLPIVPFGVYVTTIGGNTYTLTYVSTTATADTTVVESDSSTTVLAGGAIWAIPTPPPGLPSDIGPPSGALVPIGGGSSSNPLCIFGCGGGVGLPCVINCGGGGGGGDDPNQDSSPTSTSATSTSTSSSSSSSSSSSAPVSLCSPGCATCGGNFKRWARATPTAVANEKHADHGSLIRRSIPNLMDSETVPNMYGDVFNKKETLIWVEHGAVGLGSGASSSRLVQFDTKEHNLWVGGLVGCTSVIVVSRKSAYMSHLFETPSFTFRNNNDQFQADVIDYLDKTLRGDDGQVNVMFSDPSTKIYIMTPAPRADSVAIGDMKDTTLATSMSTGDPDYTDRRQAIDAKLQQLLPGITPEYFYYARQPNELKTDVGAYGKAMIMYSNNQEWDPDDVLEDLPKPKSIYQLWIQGKMMNQDMWDDECTADGDGNQKRQDGGLCALRTSTSISTSTSSSSTSMTTSTTSSTTTPSPDPNAKCRAETKVIMGRHFQIVGANWDGKLSNGDILRENLEKSCGGSVVAWQFQAPPTALGAAYSSYDFGAFGNLDMANECWKQALIDAGGCEGESLVMG